MKVALQARKVKDLHIVRWYVNRRMNFVFNQHAQYIHSVQVSLADINGPKGGVDKRCRITVELPKYGTVFVEHVEGDFYAAINRASERASRVIKNKISRRRDRQRYNHSHEATIMESQLA